MNRRSFMSMLLASPAIAWALPKARAVSSQDPYMQGVYHLGTIQVIDPPDGAYDYEGEHVFRDEAAAKSCAENTEKNIGYK